MARSAVLLCLLLLAACAADKGRIGVIDASSAVYEVPTRADATAVKPVALNAGRGPLVLHGGGRFTRAAAAAIVAHAGPDPRLCLIDTADAGHGEIYRPFDDFAGVQLSVLDLQRADVARPDVLDTLRACTGFFFGGGAPQRLSEVFRPGGRDSPALAVIRERFERAGAVVAGSSAGAMIVGPLTLCECGQQSSVLAVVKGELFKAPGFDFLAAPILIDAHFFARGLLGRHMYALARDNIPVGVGIDENTTVLVPGDGRPWRVLQGGSVALVRLPADATTASLSEFGLSILYPGDRFDPFANEVKVAKSRQPVAAGAAPAGWPRAQGLRYTILPTAATAYYADGKSSPPRLETTLDRLVSVEPL